MKPVLMTATVAGRPGRVDPAALRSPFLGQGITVLCLLLAVPGPTGPAAHGDERAAAGGDPAGWQSLFDGKQLGDWKATPFGGEGEANAREGVLRIGMGVDLSGVTWQGRFPRQDFEIELEARRVEGSDFFCGLTFPVGDAHCSLILGGWGGGVVGLSSIDGEDAANNATTKIVSFEDNRWYAVRVRVTGGRIECFLDGERIVDQPLADHVISVRHEVEPSQPLGIATYCTTAELRGIRWRPVAAAGRAPAKQ
jgi:hypothetical protein